MSETAHTVPAGESDQTLAVARNVSTRYLAIGTEAVLGILILPFNIAHLGTAAYGLWMLTASVAAYFSILDLGYSGALVKFVAQYRARRDARALNEILSTAFCVFAIIGLLTYVAAVVLAFFLDHIFQITPDQVRDGRLVLLIVTLNVAVGTTLSVFGGVINGFQRYDLNNIVGALSIVVVAVVNVMVLSLGYGLVELVASTTVVRLLAYWVYRANAYRVFPELRIRMGLFRRERLRELTNLSVYMALIDWAAKMNYSVDALVIGAFLSTNAVAIWTVGQRVADITHRLTNQLNDVLFPTVVDSDEAERIDRLQLILLQGTRLSLATVLPLGGSVILLAGPLIDAWVGPDFSSSVIVLQLLTLSVIVRVGSATASTLLKGAGRHRLLAVANIAAAISNLALSIAIVRPYGLAGVAVGTLLPVSIVALLIIFPAGCRRVQLPLRRAFARAIWPALWPTAVMALYVTATRPLVGESLVAIGVELALAALVYVATFLLFGIDRKERQFYVAKATKLAAGLRIPAVSEGV